MNDIKQDLLPLFIQYKIKKAAIFGSYARGEETDQSDLDLLIDPPEKMSYYAFYDLKEAIEQKLNKKVDLLTYRSLNPHIKPYVQKDEVIIYEAQ